MVITILTLIYIVALVCAAVSKVDIRVSVILLCIAGLIQALPLGR